MCERCSAAPHDLSQVLAFVTDERDREATLASWDAMFPSGVARPKLKFLQANLPGSSTERLEVIASIPDRGAVC